MKIGGFQKVSLIDYPGKISSIIFTLGCNFRCHFCYVPQLVLPEKIKEMKEFPEDYIFSYLEKNRKFIDAVVLTGGEPLLQNDIEEFAKKIKSMGFCLAIETNGSCFEKLKSLIEKKLVDYIAMDIKTSLNFEKYNEIVGGVLTPELFENIKKSVETILKSGIDCEFRTTVFKNFHSKQDIIDICKVIKGKKYYIQKPKVVKEVVGKKELVPFDEKEIDEIISQCRHLVKVFKR